MNTEVQDMVKHKIEDILINPEKCTGCLSCQLICSFTFTRAFNPLAARVMIDYTNGMSIHFTDECTGCALCAKYCLYGAIALREAA